MLLRILDPRFQDVLRLLDELAMQIDGVTVHPSVRVVFSKDIVGRLLVVLLHHLPMSLALLGQLVRCLPISTSVCLMGFIVALAALIVFLS